jgi:hypothetical protein
VTSLLDRKIWMNLIDPKQTLFESAEFDTLSVQTANQ